MSYTEMNFGGGGASSADKVSYNNATSGLSANNVQSAIDELSNPSVEDLSANVRFVDKLQSTTCTVSKLGHIVTVSASMQLKTSITNLELLMQGLPKPLGIIYLNDSYADAGVFNRVRITPDGEVYSNYSPESTTTAGKYFQFFVTYITVD